MVCSLPALSADDLVIQTAAWGELFESIHTAWLDECYKRAMRAHKSGEPFKAVEVLDVWRSLSSNGEFERWQINQRRTLAATDCFLCSNSGWTRFSADGLPLAFDDAQPNSRVARCSCGR